MKNKHVYAPIPYFGGKRSVVDVVWRAFGDPKHYIEPFFGGGAILLGRPGGAGKHETVGDLNHHVANFWRAVKHAPDEVAKHADNPISEIDLFAWNNLIVQDEDFHTQMATNPRYYNAEYAGRWAWGMSSCIGMKFGEHVYKQRSHPIITNETGLHMARNYSITSMKAQLTCNVGTQSMSTNIYDWINKLAQRLCCVNVICSSWETTIRDAIVLDREHRITPCAVFLDPPYDGSLRSKACYATDEHGLSAKVREWALAYGDYPRIRIALCGYEGEHTMPDSWRVHKWSAQGGMSNYGKHRNDNKHKERIWFSPHCIHDPDIFDAIGSNTKEDE